MAVAPETPKTTRNGANKWWHTPSVRFAFNLPRVSAQLEKLMGSNVVRLTDRNYMQQLRGRIQEEYHSTQQTRIRIREYYENERQKFLVLSGSFSVENCPHELMSMHSIALAREMERERNLIMKGKTEKGPKALADHPVFVVNQDTNKQIAKTRSKLKTAREINAEKLIKQGAKWERERELLEEQDRLEDMERKKKKEMEIQMAQEYAAASRVRGEDLLRVRNRDYAECEIELKQFIEHEKIRMKTRFKDVRKEHQKKLAQLEEKRRLEHAEKERILLESKSEATDVAESEAKSSDVQDTQHPAAIYIHKPADLQDNGIESEDIQVSDQLEPDYNSIESDVYSDGGSFKYAPSTTTLEHEQNIMLEEDELIAEGLMLGTKEEMDKLKYEDPMIALLNETNEVEALFNLADDIIGGTAQYDDE